MKDSKGPTISASGRQMSHQEMQESTLVLFQMWLFGIMTNVHFASGF